jgi:hypothetical protein
MGSSTFKAEELETAAPAGGEKCAKTPFNRSIKNETLSKCDGGKRHIWPVPISLMSSALRPLMKRIHGQCDE